MQTQAGNPGAFAQFDLSRVENSAFVLDAAKIRSNCQILANIRDGERCKAFIVLKTLALAAAAALLPLPALAQGGDVAQTDTTASEVQVFDAETAWSEFEAVLRGLYAYIERDDIDVDAQMERSKALALQTRDAGTFRRVIHQTALTFMDPHLIVGPFTDDDYAIIMTAADMDLRFEENRAIVRDVRRGSPAFEAGIRPGDELVTIDGEPALTAARLPFGEVLPDPSDAQLDYGLTLAANGKRGSHRLVQVRATSGAMRYVDLTGTLAYASTLNDRDPVSVDFVGANEDVAVVRVLNSLGNNAMIAAFDAAMLEAQGAKAIVLDLRETPSGGNTEVARSIIGHFITEVSAYQMHRIPVFEREFTVPRQFVEYAFPREPYFGGPVFVLHGRWTGSMGEGVVIGMDAATDAVTIGSNMGDLLGGLWNRDLPTSGARVDLGAEALFHVDGRAREDYVAQRPLTPIDTAPDGSDPGIAAVFSALEEAK